jgi:hypothetical protein
MAGFAPGVLEYHATIQNKQMGCTVREVVFASFHELTQNPSPELVKYWLVNIVCGNFDLIKAGLIFFLCLII